MLQDSADMDKAVLLFMYELVLHHLRLLLLDKNVGHEGQII